MKVGITGTREGATISQLETIETLLSDWFQGAYRAVPAYEFHDGDCLGVDDQVHRLVEKNWPEVDTHGHPCNLPKQRAHNDFDVMYDIDRPLARNRTIVQTVDRMIAAPKEYDEQWRGSGTWATMRYTVNANKPLFVVWPDGTRETEWQSGG